MTTTPDSVHPVRRPVSEAASRRANREDWDAYADEYQRTHGDFLGDVGFVWGPEGHQEADLQVLGDAGCAGRPPGARAGQRCRPVRPVAPQPGARSPTGSTCPSASSSTPGASTSDTGFAVPSVCATATALPFGDRTFDIVFSSFGALQFVADADVMVGEVARVLRTGGTFAFSVTHPVRWAMPDDAGPEGLTIVNSYWDRTPYVEEDDDGRPRYVEHHRTLGDWVALLAAAGFALTALHEPQWPEGLDRIWGGWGPVRGRLVPGTAIFVADLT